MLYIPGYLAEKKSTITNFGLLYQKYAEYDGASTHSLETKEMIKNLYKRWSHCSRDTEKSLYRQQQVLDYYAACSLPVVQYAARLTAPLLIGIGDSHPSEIGMRFDRNTGVPCIPATSVKGAVRTAYCVNKAEKSGAESVSLADEGLIALFGTAGADHVNECRGSVVFFDALPVDPDIKLDILNPHYNSYYQGDQKSTPVETDSPVPKKFLVVPAGVTFIFRAVIMKKDALGMKDLLCDSFHTAFSRIGFGAKSAIGYGRFESGDEQMEERVRYLQQMAIQKKRIEQEKKERERKALQDAEEKKTLEKKLEAEAKQKANAEDEYNARLKKAEGIDNAILLVWKDDVLEKGSAEEADRLYLEFLNGVQQPDEKQKQLAKLLLRFYPTSKKQMKKLKKNKKAKIEHLQKLSA